MWLIPLTVDSGCRQQCESLLSHDECTRAARFYFERHQTRYSVARGILRVLLGNYLNISPAAVSLLLTEFGKPVLAAPFSNVHFNLAHTGELAICAISRDYVPGVDIESAHRIVDHDALARRFFSEREFAWFKQISADQRHAAFLTCWTRKEAVAKAIGRGLHIPLDQIEVTVAPHEPPQLLSAPDCDPGDWTLCNVNAGDDFVAALAMHSPSAPNLQY
ncbi:MAG: 4-phosphopantetheinyl transferase, HetI [Betaproteobacteria bacterium]|nr:4-phosphopantetheinyl transferase, HetI [Betaproteobacteria bacterium]